MAPAKNRNLIYSGERNFDAGRLQLMAESGMDALSLANLQILSVGSGDHVLDVGAGPSTDLGDAVEALGATYTAYDNNRAAATEQAKHGHDAVEGSAHNMLLHDGTIDVVHMRAANSWFGADRDASWREIIRVGTETLRGTSIDYDWTVVSGPPELTGLVDVLEPVLQSNGFDTAYGARAETDIRRILTEYAGADRFRIESSRIPLRADSDEQLMQYVTMTATTVIQGLRRPIRGEKPSVVQAKLTKASELEGLLARVQSAGLKVEDVRLPDVVSVCFWLEPAEQNAPAAAGQAVQPSDPMETFQLQDGDDYTGYDVVLFCPGWDASRHPYGVKAVNKFHRFYRAAGHILARDRIGEGLTQEAYEEMVDARALRARQDLAVTLSSRDSVIASSRLLRPTEDGVASTPTGRKLLEKYGFEIFPEDFADAKVGEVMATVGGETEATMAALLACVYAARKAGVQKLLYGAVVDKVERHFIDDMFGAIMQPFYAGDSRATVTVTGAAYRQPGIELATGYADTEAFFEKMISMLHNKRDTQTARVIIRLCEQLDER